MTGHGIGSLLHSLASSLALAMATNRVLLYDPRDGLMFATDSDDQKTNERDRFQCKDITSFECFFRPGLFRVAPFKMRSPHLPALAWTSYCLPKPMSSTQRKC
eukprot:CAMPEP_0114395702 /NCGR_PEP_ID=MMETSP0102-20121206/13073_1 /TAXON_ID=38822 ORGANISM="Pteridomonas danica, Strain PT" /NCGR_SAMPLE_ID=MMETSP0102 /ASSEMBLY_ACC=CAM_ASM_000212 /LENGTH=102 /DNA_ID=CAMNT_0001556167 /DNA_START=190 /DNA_END=495 /DNA_ORIENTATION=+